MQVFFKGSELLGLLLKEQLLTLEKLAPESESPYGILLTETDRELTVTYGTECLTLQKPFCLRTLMYHVHKYRESKTQYIGPYAFFPHKRCLEKGDEAIILSEKETDLLCFLNHAPALHASKQTLLAKVWGYGPHLDTRTLETHVYKLRRKIEKNPEKPEILISLNQGYALKKA